MIQEQGYTSVIPVWVRWDAEAGGFLTDGWSVIPAYGMRFQVDKRPCLKQRLEVSGD